MTPSSVSAVGLADVSNPDAVAGVAVAKVNAVAIAKKESTVLLVAFVRCIDNATFHELKSILPSGDSRRTL